MPNTKLADLKDEKSSSKQPLHFVKKTFPTPFDQHADVASTVISSMLTLEDNCSLTRTSQNLHRLFSKRFNKILLLLKPLHQELLEHVIQGNFSEAKIIIEQYPISLLYKGTVIDYSNRKITGTAYQMALGAEDGEMAKMIQSHLKQLPSGCAEIMRQEAQQFPAHLKNQKKAEDAKKMKALEVITQCIIDAYDNEVTEDDDSNLKISPRLKIALTQFRNALDPQGVITTGKHFHAPLLHKALMLSIQYRDNFGSIKSAKHTLFWCQIIGYIQRFLPACYAQAFCQQNFRIFQFDAPLRHRSFKFKCNPDVSFFPLDRNPHDRLGFHYWLNLLGKSRSGYELNTLFTDFSELISIKENGMKNLMQHPALKRKRSCCLVM